MRVIARRVVPFAALLAVAAAVGGAAHAVAPGKNGKVAFSASDGTSIEIYTANADGTGAKKLTQAPGLDGTPAWSPDGKRIAFRSQRDFPGAQQTDLGAYEIYVMRADGSQPTRITNNAAADFEPSWSPDGTRIAFYSRRDGNDEIYVMNADGSSPKNLTNEPAPDRQPAWSPDGKRIAFSSCTRRRHPRVRHERRRVGRAAGDDGRRHGRKRAWSPDSKRLVFARFTPSGFDIYSIGAGRRGEHRLTSLPQLDSRPCGRRMARRSCSRATRRSRGRSA